MQVAHFVIMRVCKDLRSVLGLVTYSAGDQARSLRIFDPQSYMIVYATSSSRSSPVQGVFLAGFTARDGNAVSAWFQAVEPGFPVSYCRADMLALSLGEAFYADYDPTAGLTPSQVWYRDDASIRL